jgi:hypothetical protein
MIRANLVVRSLQLALESVEGHGVAGVTHKKIPQTGDAAPQPLLSFIHDFNAIVLHWILPLLSS